MSTGIADLMVEADKQLRADMELYNEAVEKSIFRKLGELRRQQEKLLLTLQVAHNDVTTSLFSWDDICTAFNFPRFKRSATNEMFHNNLYVAHRSYPEFGAPIINTHNLQAVEDRIMRARAEANFICNNNKAPEDRVQLPLTKTLKDINLQEFLDSLSEESTDKE